MLLIWLSSLCPQPTGPSAISTRTCCIFCTREFARLQSHSLIHVCTPGYMPHIRPLLVLDPKAVPRVLQARSAQSCKSCDFIGPGLPVSAPLPFRYCTSGASPPRAGSRMAATSARACRKPLSLGWTSLRQMTENAMLQMHEQNRVCVCVRCVPRSSRLASLRRNFGGRCYGPGQKLPPN